MNNPQDDHAFFYNSKNGSILAKDDVAIFNPNIFSFRDDFTTHRHQRERQDLPPYFTDPVGCRSRLVSRDVIVIPLNVPLRGGGNINVISFCHGRTRPGTSSRVELYLPSHQFRPRSVSVPN